MTDFQFRSVKHDTYYRSAVEAAKAIAKAKKSGADEEQAVFDTLEKIAKKETGMSFGTDE